MKRILCICLAICILMPVSYPVYSYANSNDISLAQGAINPYPIWRRTMSNHCMIEMSDRRIGAFGDNSYGQCGKPNTESYLTEPNTIVLTYEDDNSDVIEDKDNDVIDDEDEDEDDYNGVTIVQLESGGRHSVALGYGAYIFTWGDNTYGQLGRETEDYYDYNPKPVDFSDYPDIMYFDCIAVGEYHNLAVDQDGNLYAWGRNDYYQLGVTDIEYSAKPIKIAENIKAIATKFNHNLVSDKDNRLFAFGNNDCGQLGNPSITADKCAELTEVVYPEGRNRVSGLYFDVGEHHSVAGFYDKINANYDGEMYAWGDNSMYQLGIDDPDITRSTVPLLITDYEGKVSCGRNYSIIDNQYWFGTGCAVSEEYPEDVLKTPTERDIWVTPGYDGGMIDNGNVIYVWGKNDKGQLMQKPDDDWHYLKAIPFLNIEPSEDIPINQLDGAKLKINLYFLNWCVPPEDLRGNTFEMEDMFELIDADTDEVIGHFSDVEVIDDTHAVGTVKLNEDFVPEKEMYNIVVYGGYPAVTTLLDFYNTISAVKYSDKPKTMTISCNDTPYSGRTDGQIITAELTGSTFKETLDVDNWQVVGIDGVTIGTVTRVDDTHAEITLSGNNSDKYKSHNLSLVCDGREYAESITKSEDGTLEYKPLTSKNSIEVQRQRRSSGSSGRATAASTPKSTSLPTPTAEPTPTPVSTPAAVQQKQWTMVMTIGNRNILVNGETVQNDVAPKIVNDRTMLPARFVAESLGATVEWDGDKRLVTIRGKNENDEDVTILITIGAKNALVNGKEVTLDAPAFIENDRTYTPLRFISENLGAAVDWDGENGQIIITKNKLQNP